LLSDVFILPEYQGYKYGLKLVDEAIKAYSEIDKQLIFITLLDYDLVKYYEKIGFKEVFDYIMVRDER
jgi:GNAT superfamily N-acetyltransferase